MVGLIGLVLLAGLGLAAYVQARGIPHYEVPAVAAGPAPAGTPTQLALGEKLVRASCAECHLNQQTNALAGRQLLDTPQPLRVHVGGGRAGYFGFPAFRPLLGESRPRALARPKALFLLKALTNTVLKPTPLVPGPQVAPAPNEAVAYGRYQCYDCHSQDFKTNDALHPEQSVGYLGGGNQLVDAQGQPILSRNITADRATGIGTWTPAQFAAAMRVGQSPHGLLRAPMPQYSTLTDEELNGLYAYLQSVPKLDHNVPLSPPRQ